MPYQVGRRARPGDGQGNGLPFAHVCDCLPGDGIDGLITDRILLFPCLAACGCWAETHRQTKTLKSRIFLRSSSRPLASWRKTSRDTGLHGSAARWSGMKPRLSLVSVSSPTSRSFYNMAMSLCMATIYDALFPQLSLCSEQKLSESKVS